MKTVPRQAEFLASHRPPVCPPGVDRPVAPRGPGTRGLKPNPGGGPTPGNRSEQRETRLALGAGQCPSAPCRRPPSSPGKPISASIWRPGRRLGLRLPKLGRNISRRMGKTWISSQMQKPAVVRLDQLAARHKHSAWQRKMAALPAHPRCPPRSATLCNVPISTNWSSEPSRSAG